MKFSVVIPTHNRAKLLQNAIRSAVNQKFDDYEIIISNNYSEDETENLVKNLKTKDIKYFKTERCMSMADHWEYALNKASGDWILFLSDDDALLPTCLNHLNDLIDKDLGNNINLYHYSKCTYVYDDGVEENGNYITYPGSMEPMVNIIDSQTRLKSVFSSISSNMPRFLDSVVRRDFLENIKQKHGKIFHRWAPDFSSGIILLAYTDKYVRLNRPLWVWGKNLSSYGSGSFANPNHLLTFFQEFDEFDGRLSNSPYPDLITVTNGLYDTLYRTKGILPDKYNKLEIDEKKFRVRLLSDIEKYLNNGFREYAPYHEKIRTDLADMTTFKRNIVLTIKRRILKFKRRLEDKYPYVNLQKEFPWLQYQQVISNGHDKYRFENIYEASKFLSEFILTYEGSSWVDKAFDDLSANEHDSV